MPTIEEVNIKVDHTIEEVKELKEKVDKIDNYREETRLSMQRIERDVSEVKDSVKKLFEKLDSIGDNLKKDTAVRSSAEDPNSVLTNSLSTITPSFLVAVSLSLDRPLTRRSVSILP